MNLLAQIPSSAIDTAATHVEKHTDTYLILVAALGPLLALALAAIFVQRYVLPVWLAEQEANRRQKAEESEKTRQHIRDEMNAARALSDAQQLRIVDQVSGKLDHLQGDVTQALSRLSQIAAKVGVAGIVLLLIGCAPGLKEQRQMLTLASRAHLACCTPALQLQHLCQPEPDEQHVKTCSAAAQCAHAARDGAAAIQLAQEARAGAGSTQEREAAAATAYRAARIACAAGSWK